MDRSRRIFMRQSALLGLGGALGSMGLRLPALDAAAPAGDYKALVCIFLGGGNDAANMVLATDPDSWGRYQAARSVTPAPISLAAPGTPATPGALGPLGAAALGGVLPITPRTTQGWPDGTQGTGARSFALHPLMPLLQQRFAQGQLAIVANVGTLVQPVDKASYLAGSVPVPQNLFSHSDQQIAWQAGGTAGSNLGWGGLMADLLAAGGSLGTFTPISLAGNAQLLTGRTLSGYQVALQGAVPIRAATASTLFGNPLGPAALTRVITRATGVSPFQTGYGSVVALSMASQDTLNKALAGVAPVPAPPPVTDPMAGAASVNPLALQLQTVAALVSAGKALGLRRQIFFVQHGPYDYHLGENNGWHLLMAQLDGALDYFMQALGANRDQVTAATLSEFGRCFVSNGSGTDHGWGGHQLVLGGAVKGGDLYGTYPTVGVDGNGFVNPGALPNTGAWIPTLPMDQYAATFGAWMGLSSPQLLGIFPNLANFPGGAAGLGFLQEGG